MQTCMLEIDLAVVTATGIAKENIETEAEKIGELVSAIPFFRLLLMILIVIFSTLFKFTYLCSKVF